MPLTGDASVRRYARLAGPDGTTAILMDATSDTDAAFAAFQSVAAHLIRIGLAAPRILWSDPGKRLMVIQDLGPLQVAEWLTHHPDDATAVYSAAIDVLIRVQSHPAPDGLTALVPTRAAGMIAPLFDWYLNDPDARLTAQITGLLQDALTAHAPRADCLALRDFHAENLIWRGDLHGLDRVGLLDFQDAVLAPPEYDLISLLQDARRDLVPDLQIAMLERYAAAAGRDPEMVRTAAAVLGLQRNLRILGIFARLSRQDGKTRYLDLIPRVWGHVVEDLSHPALTEMRPLILGAVPPPDPVHLNSLRPR